jgi:hypothetical protein
VWQLLISVNGGISPRGEIVDYGEIESDLTNSAALIGVILIVVLISAASTTTIITIISTGECQK